MPIHESGYRHWYGEWTSHPYRWWAISRQGILLLAKRKLFLILLFLSVIPFLVRCVMLYGAVVLGRIHLFNVDAKFFEDFLTQQLFFAFVIAIYAGAGLISNDLKANALQIYLSKAITRRDYWVGKLGVAVFFISIPTLLPGFLLFLIATVLHSDLSFLRQYSWLVLPILGYSLVIIFANALIILALSSLNRSSRVAGIFFAAVFFFSQILYLILSEMLRTQSVAWMSLRNNLIQIGDLMFGTAPTFPGSPWVSSALLGLILAGCIQVIDSRVRAVEEVK